MISVSFPDNSVRRYDDGVTAGDVALSISPSLQKKSILAKIDGKITDINNKILSDCSIEFITIEEKEQPNDAIILDTIRHSCAHLLAQAVKEIYGDKIQVTIGPVIENGFYYDFFSNDVTIGLNDLPVIENKMREISGRKLNVLRLEKIKSEAIDYFNSIGEKYKVEIIDSIPSNEALSLYQQGDFIDLCRGPHVPNTSFVKYFKLTKVSGAYWRGDAKNGVKLQRIYGTCWKTKEDLDNYLKMIEEAEKRDHRKLGVELGLFHQQQESPGDVFWHKNGTTLYNVITNYVRACLEKDDYQEVRTPQLVARELWEKSGHWEKYRDHMFISRIDTEDIDLALKPMNCPCHIQIFNSSIVSYKDLPLRMAEFGKCHRYEPSGALHGLMRVRGFVQDDAHIFCTEDQIQGEVSKFYGLLKKIYLSFGFENIKIKFSDRPEKRAGSDATWDLAEGALESAIKSLGADYELNKGEGAFYGPKLEFVLKDAIGREWQCGTMQVDYVLPERLGAFYVTDTGEKKHPVMLHRAVLGSIERFIAILIENYAGSLPVWLSPVQVAVIGVSNNFDDYVVSVSEKLKEFGIRVIHDISAETVGYKVRKHFKAKVPYIITIGQKEIESELSVLSVNKRGSDKAASISINELSDEILKEYPKI